MLIKKELEALPLLPMPKARGNCSAEYATAIKIEILPNSGTVLIADVYTRKTNSLYARFFSDGSNYYTCFRWPAEQWTKANPAASYYGFNSNYSVVSDTLQAEQFLGKKEKESWRSKGALAVVDAFVSGLNNDKRIQAAHAKEELRKKHFAMYPPLPKDLDAFCDENVFEFSYIIFGKLTESNRRYGQCSHCGKKFRVPKDVKHNQQTDCPKCGRVALYKAKWHVGNLEDTSRLCVTAAVDNQLLIRWLNVYRVVSSEGVEKYRFSDYAYNLYLQSKSGRKTLYAYALATVPYTGNVAWKRYPNGDQNFSTTYVYASNLNEVFGNKYYNVDLQAGLTGIKAQLCFSSLLNNLRNIPEAEYLFKLRLPLLAANAGNLRQTTQKKPGFSQVLGVSKQLLPLYQKMCVSYDEHVQIRDYGKWVSEEEAMQYRNLKMQHHEHYEAKELIKTMSWGKFVRYFNKQMAVTKKKMHHLMIQYNDYLSMAKDMGIDTERKSLRFPDNICQAHDAVLKEFLKIKNEKENAAFAKAVKKVYAALPVKEYTDGVYCIVLPQLRTDLTAEGQSLGHCVGGTTYKKNHMKGTRMIFFVRRVEKPDKPYFTLQIDMEKGYIIQLHGRGNCNAPPDVRKFADSFLKVITPAKTEKTRRKTA